MLEITMKRDGVVTKEVVLDNNCLKAFDHIANMTEDWIENAILERDRHAIDTIVEKHSDKQPKKTAIAEKLAIVAGADIKSAKERQEEFEASLPK